MNVSIKVNTDMVLSALSQAKEKALEMVGATAEGYAVMECPVNTGNLRSSITHNIDGDTVHIGTNSEYAAYVEYGTGRHSATGGGTMEDSWVYKDKMGYWHRGHPQQPRPFIQPAIANHLDEYQQMMEDCLKG